MTNPNTTSNERYENCPLRKMRYDNALLVLGSGKNFAEIKARFLTWNYGKLEMFEKLAMKHRKRVETYGETKEDIWEDI